MLAKGGSGWLLGLRENPSRQEVQAALMELPGIGRKVADCVALFSLDQSDAVPVDTHVWDIVVRDYEPSLGAAKSLTPAVYDQVGDTFRRVFPSRAGWAHSVLFAGELAEFRQYLPDEMQAEMAEFASQGKAKKRAAKEAKSDDLNKKRSPVSDSSYNDGTALGKASRSSSNAGIVCGSVTQGDEKKGETATVSVISKKKKKVMKTEQGVEKPLAPKRPTDCKNL